MIRRKIIVTSVISLVLLSTFFGVSATNTKTERGSSIFTSTLSNAKWTVMAYMDGDGNLRDYRIEDINEMAEVGSNEDVKVIAQLGGLRFYVTEDTQPTESNADMDLGNVDISKAKTLSNFINWVKDNYQADRYLLVIAGHGYGIKGLIGMELATLNTALSDIDGGIDILVFDSCRMATIEVATAIKDKTSYMVASEGPFMATCFQYDDLLKVINADTGISSEELSKKFIEKDFYDGTTESAIDLSVVDELNSKISSLSNDLLDCLDEKKEKINEVFKDVKKFSSGADLYHFAELIDSGTSLQSANNVINKISSAVISNKGPLNTHGLTIYVGNIEAVIKENYYTDKSTWSDFLWEYHSYEPPSGPPETPTTLKGTTKNQKGNSCSYRIEEAVKDPNGDQVYYLFDFGDGENSGWLGPWDSGKMPEDGIRKSHAFTSVGTYEVRVRAKDTNNDKSGWSDPLVVVIESNGKNNQNFVYRNIFSYLLGQFRSLRFIFF
jgi:hypothetical protein